MHAALAADGLGDDTLVQAEDVGLLRLGATGATFPHPLVREAVLAAATAPARRRAHAALARALQDRPQRAALATHLADAAPGPDAALAGRLASLARQLDEDGAHEAAARAWGDASRLAPDGADATAFCLAGVEAALRADLREQAEALARRGLVTAVSARDRGLLLTRLGVCVAVGGDIPAGVAMVEEAVALLTGDERADALLELVSLRQFDIDAESAWNDVRRFGPLPENPRAWGAFGTVLCWAGRWEEGTELARRSLAALSGMPTTWSPLELDDWFNSCMCVGLHETTEQVAAPTRLMLNSGRPGWAAQALATAAMLAYAEGRWDDALDDVDEAAALYEALGRVDFYGAGMASVIASRRGDARTLEVMSQDAMEVYRRTGNDLWGGTDPGNWGFCHLAHGELDAAERRFREVTSQGPRTFLPYMEYTDFEVALIELLARTGRLDEARVRAGRLVSGWAGCPSRLGRGWRERVEAAVADDAAEPHYRAAIDALAPDVHAFAAAEARLYYGEWLRRHRRRADAVAVLTVAETAFEALRCTPWATRCRAELAAAGADVTRRDRYDATRALTPQERRVADIVATGCSNAEAARRLFLSPKTIEVHLTHVYRKLGIPGRAQLADVLRGHV